MTSPSPKGSSYWAVQIIVCAVAAIALPTLGVLLFFLSPEEPARGVILILIGIAFLVVLIRLVRSYRGMSVTQRAVYAWAVTQLHSNSDTPDDIILGTAAAAQAGRLPLADLEGLQALNPGNPYPGAWPSAPPRASHAAGD